MPSGRVNVKGGLEPIKFFYDFEGFSKKSFPVSAKKFVVLTLVSTVLTFGMYFLSSYVRAASLSNTEIAKQVLFLNFTLWGAYLLFVIGINGILVLVMRLRKIDLDLKSFLLNQTYVAVVLFVLMRFVATVLIMLDEKLPFELSLNLRFLNFSLLTVLFASQVLLIIVGYNYLRINLGEKIRKYPLLETTIAVIYTASLWTLTSP